VLVVNTTSSSASAMLLPAAVGSSIQGWFVD
jgi:hypothetical protein